MRRNTAIVVTMATLIAIGVALGGVTSDSSSNRIDGFEQIIYVRNVEHGRLALLGDCPLEREIIIERTGKTQISWYAQRPDDHGCVRAADFGSDLDEKEKWDEPKVARTELTLGPEDLGRFVDRLERLSWKAEWKAPEYQKSTYSTGCGRRTLSFPDRLLAITKSGTRMATLSVYGEKAKLPGNAKCIASEKANATNLDGAVAPFSPLLPDKYDVRPEVAGRLYRSE